MADVKIPNLDEVIDFMNLLESNELKQAVGFNTKRDVHKRATIWL